VSNLDLLTPANQQWPFQVCSDLIVSFSTSRNMSEIPITGSREY
jgi:hypothetical protein